MITKVAADKWRVRVRPYSQKTFPTRESAKAYELDLKLRKAAGELYQAAPLTLGEAIDSYLDRRAKTKNLRPRTLEYDQRNAKGWERYRAYRLNMLRRPELEDHIASRAVSTPRSARNELEFLKAVLRDARERGQRFEDGLLTIPAPKHRPRERPIIGLKECEEIASWLPDYCSRLPLVAIRTGMRLDELLGLRPADVNFDARLIDVRSSKTRAGERMVLLSRDTAALLKEQLVARPPSQFVFPNHKGERWDRHGFTKVWIRARRAANYPDVTFHALRHSSVSLMAQAGFSLEHVAAQHGWSPASYPSMFARYRRLFAGELRERVEALDRLTKEAAG